MPRQKVKKKARRSASQANVEKLGISGGSLHDEDARLPQSVEESEHPTIARWVRLAGTAIGPQPEEPKPAEARPELVLRQVYAAGEIVPSDGPYWVHHYQHRMPHLLSVGLMFFPPCNECDDRVRFEPAPMQPAGGSGWASDDRDFRAAASIIPQRPNSARSRSHEK